MGKIYFNQADARWKNKMYSSVGNKNQTMKTSGCGPTSGAMVISSLTDKTVYPDEMAEFYVESGYRTAASGTSWSAFSGTAKKYNLVFKQTTNIDVVLDCISKNGMVIMSAKGSNTALFSTNGHIIVIAGKKGDDFIIYDPYLYEGKYEINGREKKAKVDGNEVYVSVENTANESNQYFCFYADEEDVTTKAKYVNVNTALNIRAGAGFNYDVVGSLSNNTLVTVYEEKNNFARIGTNKWVSLDYLSDTASEKNINDVMVVTAKIGLNVRETPSSKAKIVTAYPYGTRVTIYEKTNNWARGIKGWMSLDYLK